MTIFLALYLQNYCYTHSYTNVPDEIEYSVYLVSLITNASYSNI